MMGQHSPCFSQIRSVIQASGIIKCSQTWIHLTSETPSWVDRRGGCAASIARDNVLLFLTEMPRLSVFIPRLQESGAGCLVSSDETEVLSKRSLDLNVTKLQIPKKKNNKKKSQHDATASPEAELLPPHCSSPILSQLIKGQTVKIFVISISRIHLQRRILHLHMQMLLKPNKRSSFQRLYHMLKRLYFKNWNSF